MQDHFFTTYLVATLNAQGRPIGVPIKGTVLITK
jgi:hypothetical protein